MGRLATYASFIKLEHTLFSLPLIYAGALLHCEGLSARLAVLILLAAAGGRVVAMGLNRLIDVELDARNPRTRQRELPSGAMHRREAWAIVGLAGLLYAASASAIAPICLQLSPIPVALFLVYPYLKRVTAFSHLGLGLAWSVAPVAGWLAASGSLEWISEVGWLWLFAWLWVTGFDVIYATMDEPFDRQAGLHSLPVELGSRKALQVAANLHAMAFLSLYMLWLTEFYSRASLLWLLAVSALFVWQHAVAERKPEFAFFTLNGAIGFLVFGCVLSGLR